MNKLLRSAVLALLAATATVVPAVAFTQTNVLQNITLQLTIYQQGAVAVGGKKLPDKVTSFNTKNLISALEGVTGTNFGAGAKLVQSTVYANANITTGSPGFSNGITTNFSLATNETLNVGGATLFGIFGDPGVVVISSNSFISNYAGSLSTDVVSTTNNSLIINTNAGYITTLTPTTNGSGALEDVTNVAVSSQLQVSNAPSTNVFTNVSTSIDILYGGTANLLYPITNYMAFFTNSQEIVVEAGVGLDTATPALTSQSGFSISNLLVSYFTTASATNNLNLNLTGFVKQAMKIDVLSGHGASEVAEDIFGASSTWSVIGSGYSGGSFSSTNTAGTAVPVANYVDGIFVPGYLINPNPIVVQGTVTLSFLKNLPQ
jgi:hypothetical protein